MNDTVTAGTDQGQRFTGSGVSFATAATALLVTGEEGMSEGLLQTEALSWVILHHPLYEVKELPVVFALRHHVMLEGFAVFPDVSPSRAMRVPVKLTPVNVTLFLGFLQEVCGDGAKDSFHHSKVLFAVMGLKESRSEVVLDEYAAYTPNITGMIPAQIQNNFRGTVVTR